MDEFKKLSSRILFERWKTLYQLHKGSTKFPLPISSLFRANKIESELVSRQEDEYITKIRDLKAKIKVPNDK